MPFAGSGYIAAIEVVPTTLTINTVYFSLKNTGTNRLKILRIFANTCYIGALNAATLSVFGWARASGIPAGGNTFTAVQLESAASSANSEIRYAPGGITGLTLSTTDRLPFLEQTSQVVQARVAHVDFPNDLPFALDGGECLVLYAYIAVIANVQLHGYVLFVEE